MLQIYNIYIMLRPLSLRSSAPTYYILHIIYNAAAPEPKVVSANMQTCAHSLTRGSVCDPGLWDPTLPLPEPYLCPRPCSSMNTRTRRYLAPPCIMAKPGVVPCCPQVLPQI